MAAVGDTLNWATIIPTTLALMCPYALKGYWWPAIVTVLIGALLCNTQAFVLMQLGYNLGSRAVKELVQSGLINKFINFFTTLGLFVIGGMISSLVHVTTPIEITASGVTFALQTGLFDELMPNILTLFATVIIYRFMKKENVSVLKVIYGTMIIGIVLGVLGVIV